MTIRKLVRSIQTIQRRLNNGGYRTDDKDARAREILNRQRERLRRLHELREDREDRHDRRGR